MDQDTYPAPPERPVEAPARPEAEEPGPPGRERGLAGGLLLLFAIGVGIVAWLWRGQPVTTSHYLLLSLLLFATGGLGVLMRRNALVLFMCIELMLNAVNVAFVAFARMHGRMDGQVIVLFVMIVAAAEVAIGLAIIVSIFRRRLSANVDEMSLLRW